MAEDLLVEDFAAEDNIIDARDILWEKESEAHGK